MDRILRLRHEQVQAGLDLLAGPSPIRTARMDAQVYDGGNMSNTVPAVFLCHPVAYDAAEAEGAGWTADVDTGTSIPVLVLGPSAPAAGDILKARSVGGRWVAERGGGTTDVLSCMCDIPLVDQTYYGLDGGVIALLHYDVAHYLVGYNPGVRWYSDCVDFHGDALDRSIVTAKERLTFGCVDGAFFLQTEDFFVPGVGGADSTPRACTPDFPFPGTGLAYSLAGFSTCSNDPFYLEIGDDVSGEYPGYIGTPNYKFNVAGCNGAHWAGVTVDLWTSPAKAVHVGSATTDAAGDCTITGIWAHADLSGGGGPSPYYEVSGVPSRYDTASGTIVGPGRGVTAVTLSASSGYSCIPGCDYPIADTLHLSHPVFGAVTLAHVFAGWLATLDYSYPGYGSCPAVTAKVYFRWDGGTVYTERWASDGTDCPPGGDIGPDDPFTGDPAPQTTASWTAGAKACYVPSSTALDQVFTFDPTSAARYTNMYQGTALLTIHITE